MHYKSRIDSTPSRYRYLTVLDRVRHTWDVVSYKLIRCLDGFFARHSLAGDHTFFSNESFPWVRDLEARASHVRKELEKVLAYQQELPNFQDIATSQRQITNDDGWKTFFFYAYGLRLREIFSAARKRRSCLRAYPA